MQINFTVFATGVILAGNKLRYKAYEASTPSAEVVSLTENPPHTFPHAVTLNVPNPVVHIVKIFSTPDASAGTLISEFIYDPTYTNVEVRLPLQLIAGGPGEFDPAVDANQLNIPFLTEWEGLWYPERRANAGTMADYEYTILSTGGLQLTSGDTFDAGELIWIHFNPKITISTPVYNYLNLFVDIAVITADVTLDSSYYRKLLEIASTTTSITVTLPLLATIPNQTIFAFETSMGNQKQAKIAVQDSNIKFLSGNRNAIELGTCEYLWLLKEDDGFHVMKCSEGVLRVGAYVDHDIVMPNTSIADGGPLPAADYPRVLRHINSLPAGLLLTKTARDAGGDAVAGQWAWDVATQTIYKPDRRGLVARALPGTRGNDMQRDNSALPGSYRPDWLKSHYHYADETDPTRTFAKKKSTKGPNSEATNPVLSFIYLENKTGTAGDGPENTVRTVGVLRLVYL